MKRNALAMWLWAVVLGLGCSLPPQPQPVVPDPPKPNPVVPVTVPGLRILVLTDSTAVISLNQVGVLGSVALRSALDEICVKDKNGKPDWRSWDYPALKEAGVDHETQEWRTIWESVKTKEIKLPCFVASVNGRLAVAGVPENEEEAVKVVRRFK